MDGQIGLEATPEEWVAELVAVFREVRRLLKPHGTLWVECGDSYCNAEARKPYGAQIGNGRGNEGRDFGVKRSWPKGLKPKDLLGQPWMLAFALRQDGWWLRQAIIWNKPNCLPESATDRCTMAHSYVFLLSKSARYFFDAEAISEPAEWARWGDQTVPKYEGTNTASGWKADGRETKNPRSVWTIPTQGFSARALGGGATRITSPDCPMHGDQTGPAPTEYDGERADVRSSRIPRSDTRHAQELLNDCAPTGPLHAPDSSPDSSDSPRPEHSPAANPHSSENRRTGHAPATSQPCTPSAETVAHTGDMSASPLSVEPDPGKRSSRTAAASDEREQDSDASQTIARTDDRCTCKVSVADHFATWPEALVERIIKAGCPEGGVCFDPFMGSGTTALVARRLGRKSVGVELNADYAAMCARRLQQLSLLSSALPNH